MKTFQTIALLAVTCLIAVAWAQSPPTPPMSLHNLKAVKWSGTILTLTNWYVTTTTINGELSQSVTNGVSTERVELGLSTSNVVVWRQVAP